MSIAQPSHRETQQSETVEQFLARGGKVERVEEHPDPDGRVLRRGQRADEGRPRAGFGVGNKLQGRRPTR